MPLTDQQKDSIVKELYLIFKDKRSDQNWLRNEPSWDNLGEDERTWWKDFVSTTLRKVALEQKSLKITET